MIQLCLNGRWLEIEETDPSETLLHYLRTKLGHKGTKEGCASGDCGACTTVVAQYSEEQKAWHYRAINSCITLLASLHGKQVITVEGIAKSFEGAPSLSDLHPVQRALVEHHGSQCGFCTPGIVMSLYSAHENNGRDSLSEDQVLDSLSGNLCRCTGYRPIVDAGLQCHQHVQADLNPPVEQRAVSESGFLLNDHAVCYFPTSESELLQKLALYPNARFVAGGTDLLLEKTQLYKPLNQLIGLSDVAELKTINIQDSLISIGSAVTYSELETEFKTRLPEMVELFHRIGSRQIRNQGTLAGNIANASPIGDTPPFLLALDAKLELNSGNGLRTVALNDFFIDYKKTELQSGEYIRRVLFELPSQGFSTSQAFLTNQVFLKSYKISKRFEDDISAALLVVRWNVNDGKFENVRISVGGMASIPKRVSTVEQALEGMIANVDTINTAKALFKSELTPLSDVRASANYRLTVVENLLTKAWLEYSNASVNNTSVENASVDKECRIGVWSPTKDRKVSQSFGGDYA